MIDKDRTQEIKKNLIKTGAAVSIGASALTGCAAEMGGSDSPEGWGDTNSTINAVNLYDEARLRSNPYVEEGEQGSNNLMTVHVEDGGTLSIPTELDTVRVHEDNYNGDWYGVLVEDLAKQGIVIEGDNDGVVWANSQKADVSRVSTEQLELASDS